MRFNHKHFQYLVFRRNFEKLPVWVDPTKTSPYKPFVETCFYCFCRTFYLNRHNKLKSFRNSRITL